MTKLYIPPLIDVSNNKINISINNSQHKFSRNSKNSGSSESPLFGSTLVINDIKYKSSYGLPWLQFKKNKRQRIKFNNKTDFSFNIHWHGINTACDIDGSSALVEFGPETKFGNKLKFKFNKIHNNSALYWYHAHPMFMSMFFVYNGIFGMLNIIDDETSYLSNYFEYGNNHIILAYNDAALDDNGVLVSKGLLDSPQIPLNYGIINGTSCFSWCECDNKFIDELVHTTSNKLVKIDIIDNTFSFKKIYVGICDEDYNIKNFYYIQTDSGLRDPILVNNIPMSAGNRNSLIYEMDNEPVYFFISDNPELVNIKKSVKLVYKQKSDNKICKNDINDLITSIRKSVFGENLPMYNSINDNYIQFLNRNYYYNLPELTKTTRNIILFNDNTENYGRMGSTECIIDTHRIFTDMWNSDELDLNYALTQYNVNPNNYKPNILPSCLFSFFETSTEYMNYKMIENDKLVVQLFDSELDYESLDKPIISLNIVFQPTNKPLNINQLIDVINDKFNETKFNLFDKNISLGSILSLDWTFYPYKISYIDVPKTIYIKTIMMKLTNKSKYYIKLIGKWQLLQFFGKPLAALMINMSDNDNIAFVCPSGKGEECTCVRPSNKSKDDLLASKSINLLTYPSNKNMEYQDAFSGFATNNINEPIITTNDFAVLIIKPVQIYYGFIDGYQSESLFNFSVKINTSEKWIYNDLTKYTGHPLHFHLTSGYAIDCDEHLKYSVDTYKLGGQRELMFYLKFINYDSENGLFKKPINYLGFMYHCHMMVHHDMNMMGQYFVYNKRSDYFDL